MPRPERASCTTPSVTTWKSLSKRQLRAAITVRRLTRPINLAPPQFALRGERALFKELQQFSTLVMVCADPGLSFSTQPSTLKGALPWIVPTSPEARHEGFRVLPLCEAEHDPPFPSVSLEGMTASAQRQPLILAEVVRDLVARPTAAVSKAETPTARHCIGICRARLGGPTCRR